MEHEEKQEPSLASLPVLPRLDRLDRLLQLLEGKHHKSGRRHSCSPAVVTKTEHDDGQCKALSSALEEVHHKGTLMERLSMLENRVLQLSLDMDEGNNPSRSSSSTATVSDILGQDSVVTQVSSQHEGEIVTHLEKQGPLQIQVSQLEDEEGCGGEAFKLIKPTRGESETKQRRKANKNWIGWFRMGC